MSNQPLVSVIIPNYNHARFLDERIKSVLGQTYQNIEVIILDDCSTDNSREVIEKYRSNPKVTKIVYNEKNTGKPFQQWNKGMELAAGNIIWIAESDDSCAPQMLERLVNLYLDCDCVLCFSRLLYTYEDGSPYMSGQTSISSEQIGQWWYGVDFIQKQLAYGNVLINASGAIFDKLTALQVDHGFEIYKGSGDWLFWIEMAERGKVGFDSHAMNYFRQHGNNTTVKLYRNGIDMIEDHSIWLYLRAKNLISKKQAWELQKNRIIWQMKYQYDSATTRSKVLKTWGYNNLWIRLRIFFFRVFNFFAIRI